MYPSSPPALTLALTLWTAVVLQTPPPAGPATQMAVTTQPDELTQKLDESLPAMRLQSVTLSEIVKKLSDATGMSIRIEPEALAVLPGGTKTKFANLQVQDATLRQTLAKILAPLGLRYTIEEGGIAISAMPALTRMERPATWDELRFVQRLEATPYSPEEFAKIKILYRLDDSKDGPAGLTKQLAKSGRGSIAEMLEVATSALHWAWLPDGDHIAIISAEAVNNRKLSRRVTENYPNKHLGFILTDLGRQAGVHVHFQPGAFRKTLLNDVDSYSLNLSNASIRQALDQIRADTGLDYQVQYDGVHIGPADDLLRNRLMPRPDDDDPFVAKVSVPLGEAGSLEFLLHESELPPELLDVRDRVRKDFIDRLRKAAATQASSTPASAPASAPADAPASR